MIHDIIIAITTWVTHVVEALGYPGVALLMAIESAAIPLPSEVIMPFAGFLVADGHFNLWLLALAGAVGSTVGSYLTYYVGYHGGRPLVNRYGHLFFVSEEDLDISERFFGRFGNFSTLIGRVLPIVRTFISIPAGIAKVPLGPFLAYAFVGSFVWSYFLAWLGLKLGENWERLGGYFHKFDVVIVGFAAVFAIWWIWRHYQKRIK
jgi:membrane protein DedA with SNARE-associated domain